MEKTNKPSKQYFTRKNFIAFSVVALYAILLIFVALCLDRSSLAILSKKNPFAMFADALHFKQIQAGVFGIMYVVLVAIYILIFAVAFVFEKRLAFINDKPQWSRKMILIYLATLFCCLALSVGVGLLIQPQLTAQNSLNNIIFLGECLAISLMIFLLLGVFIGAIVMLIINFVKVDKPFEFFDSSAVEELIEDDEEQSVSSNFDEVETEAAYSESATSSGFIGGGSSLASAVELDDREKVFPALSAIDIKHDGFTDEPILSDDVTLKQICEGFRNYLAKYEHLYYDITTIRLFVSGLAASRLIILEGLSGTGKSSLPRYFCKYIGGVSTFLAVQATWRDRTNLLGYFNDFSKTYNETDFLSALYEANYETDRINLFVLDEFNISRVEYYFADFLSVLEFPTPEWKLKLMQLPASFLPPVKLENGCVRIPENCYFVATANKDDSTFSVADKVYDRAITIEFTTRNEIFEPEDDSTPINIGSGKLNELFNDAKNNTINAVTDEDVEKFTKVTDFIYSQFDITVGNRVLNQIDTLVPVYVACGGKKEEVLDFILARKVISKLEGRFEDYVKIGLKQLQTILTNVYGANGFTKSAKMIETLLKKL